MNCQYLLGIFACISRYKYTHGTWAVPNDAFCIQREAISDFNRTFAYWGAKSWNSLPSMLKDYASSELYAKTCRKLCMSKIWSDTSSHGQTLILDTFFAPEPSKLNNLFFLSFVWQCYLVLLCSLKTFCTHTHIHTFMGFTIRYFDPCGDHKKFPPVIKVTAQLLFV